MNSYDAETVHISNMKSNFDLLTQNQKKSSSGDRQYMCVDTVQNWKSEFDLDLKIYKGPPQVNKCVKYHLCMSKLNEVIMRKR